ncbi:hypothetical protein [Streptomyces anandii]|uniref:hypothetical protein n=1 Tax=Streptomyces anandii TaxID=285454 RepID=UPI001678A69C|nr:hypothetical protein [Streptomyces anandii]GGX94746.1 hypothetical protein GCM10010510_44980 [Streptomyces anandii JCM 4720]
MIGLVTQQAREALEKARKDREQPRDEAAEETPTGTENPGLAPAHAIAEGAQRVQDEEREERKRLGLHTRKGMLATGPQTAQVIQGGGPVTQALAGHVYAAQHHAVMPHHLTSLQTTEAPAPAGPTFAPGTATAQQQNHRAPTHAFPQAHAPGQVPLHTAPINTGGQR